MTWYLRAFYGRAMKLTAPTEALRFAFIVHHPRREQGRLIPAPRWGDTLRYSWYRTMSDRAARREQVYKNASLRWGLKSGEAARKVYA